MLASLTSKDPEHNKAVALHKQYGHLTTEIILRESDQRANLFTLRKQNEKDLERTLQLLMIELAKSVNVARNLTKDQVIELSVLIPEEFKSIKLEEVYLVMKRFKAGKTTIKIVDRLDVELVMKEFKHYFDERCEKAAFISEKFHEQTKSLGNTARTSDNRSGELSKHREALKYHLQHVLPNQTPPTE